MYICTLLYSVTVIRVSRFVSHTYYTTAWQLTIIFKYYNIIPRYRYTTHCSAARKRSARKSFALNDKIAAASHFFSCWPK